MSSKISVGIDVGTSEIKIAVAEFSKEKGKGSISILGTGRAESKGLRHGYVTDMNEAAKSIAAAANEAEKAAGIKIKRAFISVGGASLGSLISQSSVIMSRADGEVTELDLKHAIEAAENDIPPAQSANKKIILPIPLQYKLDNKIVMGRPLGMKGSKLEVRALFVTCMEQHLSDLIAAVEEAGIEVTNIMATPLAESLVVLSKAQQIAGCVLADIGAETVSIAVFENSLPILIETYSLGGAKITNDIALGLKVPLEEAEQIKLGAITTTPFPKKKLDEIIQARLADIFDLIQSSLRKIGKNGLLPAGIILSGAGSKIGFIEEMAKDELGLPAKVAEIILGESSKKEPRDPAWAAAYGLCIWGLSQEDPFGTPVSSRISGRGIFEWAKQFLP